MQKQPKPKRNIQELDHAEWMELFLPQLARVAVDMGIYSVTWQTATDEPDK